MVVKELQEIQQLIGGVKRILITTKQNPGFDELTAALALRLWLSTRTLERIDIIAVVEDKRRNRFKFLPGADLLRQRFQAADRFVIQIDVSKTKARELSYDLVGDKLEIHLKPEGGSFSARDVSFSQSEFSYDCIIVIGAPDLAALGPVFEENRDLFFQTPVINIDRHPSNVRYGQINAVYLTATSLAEIVHELVRAGMTKDIATCLLTGLISATNSFQSPAVIPDTLRLASELIVAGAPREEIVTHLYRTKDMDKLKIWGKVLSRLNQVDERIVFSRLTKEETGGSVDIDLAGLVDDLVLTSPEAHVVLFFYGAAEEETQVYAFARENYDLLVLLSQFEPRGTRQHISFTLKKPLDAAEIQVLDAVRNQLRLIGR